MMRANARLLAVLLGIGFSLACGPKRPPSVSRPGAPPPPPVESGQPSAVPRPGDEGPGVLGVSPDDVSSVGAEAGGARDRASENGLADIHFAYDESDLSPEAQAILQGHAAWLQANPGMGLVIEGHCDERGTVEYNLALGARRAETAREFLAALGVEASRMRTVSYGKERPLDVEASEAAWARNRRAHFVPHR